MDKLGYEVTILLSAYTKNNIAAQELILHEVRLLAHSRMPLLVRGLLIEKHTADKKWGWHAG